LWPNYWGSEYLNGSLFHLGKSWVGSKLRGKMGFRVYKSLGHLRRFAF